ncbi:MAG: RluA family pseudouridine synthase [Bacteroidales bacterium]|nr:RluA family pseudouridine synthase [Bacteroidales bacterium]
MTPLYEDNHLLIVSKTAGEITQGDKTGDTTLTDTAKAYLKAKYNKPGNVFIGLPHRLDRPTSGIVILAKTSKALTRLNDLFRQNVVHKTYLAIVEQAPQTAEGELTHYLVRNERQNKSYAHPHPIPNSKEARLRYRTLATSDRYTLLEVTLLTGRHHQIRCQLAYIGSVIKGDLKYGARRSNLDGSICLHAYHVAFEHPVSHALITINAPVPTLAPWPQLATQANL